MSLLTPCAAPCVKVSLFWYPSVAQFSELQVLCDNFLHQGVGNLQEMTAQFRNCEATILHNAFRHKFHKVVRNDGRPPAALLIMHMLLTCYKLPAPATHHLLPNDVSLIDLTQLTMNFDHRYNLCIQKLYHSTHFTVGGSWHKSLHLQPLQRCYCDNSGSPTSVSVMRRHYSMTCMQSLQTIKYLLAVGRMRNILCRRHFYTRFKNSREMEQVYTG